MQPLAKSHASLVQLLLSSQSVIAVPTHLPLAHASPLVQALPSSQLPLEAAKTHLPPLQLPLRQGAGTAQSLSSVQPLGKTSIASLASAPVSAVSGSTASVPAASVWAASLSGPASASDPMSASSASLASVPAASASWASETVTSASAASPSR